MQLQLNEGLTSILCINLSEIRWWCLSAMETYLRTDINTFRHESICQPVALHTFASSSFRSSSLFFSPLSSPHLSSRFISSALLSLTPFFFLSCLSSTCTSNIVADAISYYAYLRRARVQGEWHVHDASLGALRRAAITRGSHDDAW